MREERIMLLSVVRKQYYLQLNNNYYKSHNNIAIGSFTPSAAAEIFLKCYLNIILKRWIETEIIIYSVRFADV